MGLFSSSTDFLYLFSSSAMYFKTLFLSSFFWYVRSSLGRICFVLRQVCFIDRNRSFKFQYLFLIKDALICALSKETGFSMVSDGNYKET